MLLISCFNNDLGVVTCQGAAPGGGWRPQQLGTVEEKQPQVSEEAEGRCPGVAELPAAMEGRHPPDRG